MNGSTFLTLGEQTSRLYISHIALIFVLTLWKGVSFFQSMIDDIDTLKTLTVSACARLENDIEEIAGLSQQIVRVVNTVLEVLINTFVTRMLEILASGLEFLGDFLVFLLSLYRGTLQCVVIAIVDGSIQLLKEQAVAIQRGLQQTVDGATNLLNTGISETNTFFQNVASSFGAQQSSPSDVPQIGQVIIPDVFVTSLQSITVNASTLMTDVESYIKLPFKFAADAARQVIPLVQYNGDLIKERNATVDVRFCDQAKINDLFQPLGTYANTYFTGFIVLVCVVFVIALVLRILALNTEFKIFKSTIDPVMSDTIEWLNDQDSLHEPQKAKRFYFYQNLKSASIINTYFKTWSNKKKWYLMYLWHIPSIIFFSLGIVTLLLCCFKLALLNEIQTNVLPKVNAEMNTTFAAIERDISARIKGSTGDIITDLNKALENAEKGFNDNTFKKIETFYQGYNGSIEDIKRETEKFLKQTLKLDPLAPILDNLTNCIFRIILFRAGSVLEFIGSWHIKLPRFDLKFLDRILVTPITRCFKFFNISLFGQNGVSQKLQVKWLKHVHEEIKFGTILVALGCAVPLQGFLYIITLCY
jgi:hypothetical protein